jgi:hypothetical protein
MRKAKYPKPRPMDTSPEAVAKRTDAILAKFKGLPGEFNMLKGLLLLGYAFGDAEGTLGEYSVLSLRPDVGTFNMPVTGSMVADRLYDGMKLAKRMDEINSLYR